MFVSFIKEMQTLVFEAIILVDQQEIVLTLTNTSVIETSWNNGRKLIAKMNAQRLLFAIVLLNCSYFFHCN